MGARRREQERMVWGRQDHPQGASPEVQVEQFMKALHGSAAHGTAQPKR